MTPPPEKVSPPPPSATETPAARARREAGEQPPNGLSASAEDSLAGVESSGLDATPAQETMIAVTDGGELAIPEDQLATQEDKIVMGAAAVGIEGQSTEAGRELNELKMAEKAETQGWVRRTITRLWRGSSNKEAYERRYAGEARKKIQETGNIHEFEGGSKEDSDATLAVVTERLLEEGVQYIGESRTVLSESTPENKAYIEGVKDIVAAYAKGEIDEAAFVEAKDILLKDTFPKSEELTKQGALFADNLLVGARQVKLRFEHDEALEDLLDSLQFVGAETDVGVNSETKLSRTEKLYDKVLDKNWGPFNAVTVAFAATTLVALSRRGVTSTASKGAGLLIPIGGALVIGGLAAKREAMRLNKERTSIARGEASGIEGATEVDEKASRWKQRLQRKSIEKRERLEATTYGTAGAGESADYLNSMFEEDSETLRVTSPEEYADLMYRVAKLEIMLETGDEEGIDLLHYSSIVEKEQEKWELYKAISRITMALDGAAEEFYPEQTADTVREVYKEAARKATGEIEADRTQADDLYTALKRKESAKAGFKGVAVTVLLAGTVQGAMALNSASDNFPGAGGRSLEGVLGDRQYSGPESTDHVLTTAEALSTHGLGRVPTVELSDSLDLKLPNGAYYESSGSGVVSVFDSHGELLQTIDAPGGNLSPGEITRLTDEGFLSSRTVSTSEFSGNWSQPVEVTEGLDIKLPEGYSVDQASGGYSITGPDGSSVGEFTVGPNGQLTAAGVANLEANGFNVSEVSGLESTTVAVNGQSAGEFMDSYQGSTRQVSMEQWYGNGTEIADGNEPLTYISVDDQGNVTVEISSMTPGGSTTGTESIDPLAGVNAGKVELLISVDPSNPNEVVSIPFENVDGHYIAEIAGTDDASQLFGVDGGRGEYGLGANWLSIAEVRGENAAGITEVASISSIRGPNVLDDLTTHVTGTQEASMVTLTPGGEATIWEVDLSPLEGGPEDYLPLLPIVGDFTRTSIGGLKNLSRSEGQDEIGPLSLPAPDPTPALPWRPPFGYLPAPRPEEDEGDSGDVPPVVMPPVPQNELNFTEGTFNSSITAGPVETPEFTSVQTSGDTFVETYSGYGGSSVEVDQARQEFSPRISADSAAELQPKEELTGYREQIAQSTVHGESYLETVDSVIDSTPELASLPSATRAIVTMPVDIAGSGGSVYRALDLFAAQKSEDALAATTILVYGYYPGIVADDADSTVLADYSAEIDRFKADHPNVRIASVEKRVADRIANDPTKIPGYIGRHMSDTAMLSVERAMDQGTLPPDQDVLMIKNNVDQLGISLNYLQRMLDEAEKYPETDIFMGATLWNTSEQVASAGLGVVTNFKEVMDLLSSRRPTAFERPTLSGNTAVRMSTLAAVGGLGFGDYMGPGSDDLEIGRRIRIARAGSENILRHVTGAEIDTKGRSVVEAYRKNRSITVALPTEVGQRPEASSPDQEEDQKDNLSSEEAFAPTLARIERNLSEMASEWYQDPGLVEAGLIHMFRKLDSGRDAYEVVWRNGVCTVRFTDVGKEDLRNSLLRDSSGRFNTYGRRRRLGRYGFVAHGAKNRRHSTPRMHQQL